MKTTFILLTLLLFLCISNLSSSEKINYKEFTSISDIIDFESNSILHISDSNYEKLSEAYASRGESYFLCDNLQSALDDFQESYNFGIQVDNADLSYQLVFRALFGQALVYSYLDMLKEVESISKALLEIIRSIQCSDCQDTQLAHVSRCPLDKGLNSLSIMLCSDVPISGPNKISIQDCLDMVENTRYFCKLLIAKAPGSARALLTFTIDSLASEATKCCLAGSLWKACFQPLANKYHQWNQKWKIFGIPPDPAWD